MGDRYGQALRDAHEFGERLGCHLLHHVPSMELQCNLADPQFRRGLLIEKSTHHKREHLALTGVSSR